MSTSNLIRWSGFALTLGGIGEVAHVFTHPPGETAQDALATTWALSHWLGFAGSALILFGLVGLYARQSDKVGRLGLIGFILAFVGTFVAGAINLADGYLLPVVARQAPALLEAQGPIFASSGAQVAVGLQTIGMVFGYILLGIATMRAAVLPRWGGLLVVISVLMFFGAVVSPAIGSVAAIVLSIGLAWLGFALWLGAGGAQSARQPQGL